MALNEYRKKRNFKKTSEPKGQKLYSNGVLHFVVQEHHASHLHYDFRLESQGVLKSWAVPKGVSDDPTVKRLAVEVEDHPLDYQYFEGTIPKGNYGAGTVSIWDKGEYYVDPGLNRKENDKRVQESLKKGHLNFYIKGKKLKGQFSLVRLKNQNTKKNNWLLIKKQNKDVPQPSPNQPPSPIQPPKLKRPGSPSQPPKLTRPNKMPVAVKPMLATLTSAPFDRKGWTFEVKWDGYRILAYVKKHKVELYSRNNQTYTDKFKEIAKQLTTLPDVVLDGEVVVVDEKGISRFQLLQNYLTHTKGELIYYVFDILYLNGRDLHRLPLVERKEILKGLIPPGQIIRLSDSVEERGKGFFKVAKEHGLEGVIGKNLASTYEFGQRSLDWLKVKAIQEQEAIICGFTEPRGSRKFFGALILGIYKGKQLTYVGHTGGGFDFDLLKSVYGQLKPLISAQCPFKVKPQTNAPVKWVLPKLLCQVKFQEWTQDHQMRQPIFLGMREDKKPQEVSQEVAEPIKKVLSPVKDDIKTKAELTHLEKLYWPEEGYTKGDVIRYYQSIATYILPHLKDRPESLRRQPHGVIDEGFFQKDMNFKPPAWVKTTNVASESRGQTVHYLICNDKDTLAYMNNLGCIEINPWCSRVQTPHHPDFLVLDFDPVDVDFPTVIDTVLTAKDILTKAKMEGFVKTSGSRGMHVYIPLKHKYTFDQTKDFSQVLCMVIQNKLPNVTSMERSPQKRKGRIYLDYLQNHYTSTMAAPYSLRPKPGATVSAPLEWKEVRRTLDMHDFNIRTMPARLKKKGDLWKGISTKSIDMEKSLKILEKL